MFGRDLREQVQEDSENSEVFIPIIVEKCINAVENNGKFMIEYAHIVVEPHLICSLLFTAMEYEGIYRKSGGSGQSKAITALFEKREYGKFDDPDAEAAGCA